MREILFLVHRIPYPPDKGDKIRSWHFLSHLVEHCKVHLGCFVDDDDDLVEHAPVLRDLCGESYFARIRPWVARARCLAGLCNGSPLTLHHYHHSGLHAWVQALLLERPVDCVFAFSSAMAQYAMGDSAVQCRRVIDFVDVDSDKWRQFSETKIWPASWLYRREARTLLAFEQRVAAEFDAALFVSAAEAELFRSLAPEQAHKVFHIGNGVDFGYFSPDADYENPYAAGDKVLVFTGAMDYWPNVDAVTWFADEILPRVQAVEPQARFCVVGARPTPGVCALGRRSGVTVTDRVPDVRPYIAHATVVVAPLRIARGLQNKVLEGMSMAKPVVATPAACQGLEPEIRREILLAPDAKGLADLVVATLCSQQRDARGQRARARVLAHNEWGKSLSNLIPLLRGEAIASDETSPRTTS